MKKILFILLLATAISYGQVATGTYKTGKLQLNIPDRTTDTIHPIVVWDSISKMTKAISRKDFLKGISTTYTETDPLSVHLTGNQAVEGIKTFNAGSINIKDQIIAGVGSLSKQNDIFVFTDSNGKSTGSFQDGAITVYKNNTYGAIAANLITGNRTYSLPNASGTFALTSDIPSPLGFTPENVANKSNSYTVSSTTTYPNTKALVDGLATKQPVGTYLTSTPTLQQVITAGNTSFTRGIDIFSNIEEEGSIRGRTDEFIGIQGEATAGTGVKGISEDGTGVIGISSASNGVRAYSETGTALLAEIYDPSNTNPIARFLKDGVNQANISHDGKLTANGLIVPTETASTIASFDVSKNIKSLPTTTYPSLTELSYAKGVTSAIQTQLNGKQASLGFTPENVANKSDSYTVSSSTTYSSTKALVDGLATKATDSNVLHKTGNEIKTGTLGIISAGIPFSSTSTDNNIAISGTSNNGDAVVGTSQSATGVRGQSTSNVGVNGISTTSSGVYGTSTSGAGVMAYSTSGAGIRGYSETGLGAQINTDSGSKIASFLSNSVEKVAIKNDGKITAVAGTDATDVVVKSQLDAVAGSIPGALGYTPENVANKSNSYTASSTTTYPNTKALVDGLATKQDAGTYLTAIPTLQDVITQGNSTNAGIILATPSNAITAQSEGGNTIDLNNYGGGNGINIATMGGSAVKIYGSNDVGVNVELGGNTTGLFITGNTASGYGDYLKFYNTEFTSDVLKVNNQGAITSQFQYDLGDYVTFKDSYSRPLFNLDAGGNVTFDSYLSIGKIATFKKNGVEIASISDIGTLEVTPTDSEETAIIGNSLESAAIRGNTDDGTGVMGYATGSGNGLHGFAPIGEGLVAETNSGTGAYISAISGTGVSIYSFSGKPLITNIDVANTSNIAEFKKNSVNQASISHDGKVTANSFIKSGGLNTEYLMGDGSISTGPDLVGKYITEATQTGIVFFNNDRANYGNIGVDAVDFSYSGTASSTLGATGESSFNTGIDNTASGYNSTNFGYKNITSATGGFTSGFNNSNAGYTNFITGTGHSATGMSMTVVGQASNVITQSTATFNEATAPVFVVGNGTITDADPDYTVATRSDAMIVRKNGTVEVPTYGSGTVTGTPTYALAVDTDGKIIETALGGGSTPTLQQVTTAGSTTDRTIYSSVSDDWAFEIDANSGDGIDISTTGGYGIRINSTSSSGSPSNAIEISAVNAKGISATSFENVALEAISTNGHAIEATSSTGNGIFASSVDSDGVYAYSTNGYGLTANSDTGTGIRIIGKDTTDCLNIINTETSSIVGVITGNGNFTGTSFATNDGIHNLALKADKLVVMEDAIDNDFGVQVNSMVYLPSGTLTENRTIMIPVGLNGDIIEIYNNETGFVWNLAGELIYLSNGTTVLTSLAANTNYLIRYISGKWRILN